MLISAFTSSKGISKTPGNTWRVQLKLGNENGIFSRNLSSLEEALWIYELKVLISDEPRYIHEMCNRGNYDALLRLNVCTSCDDYVNRLMSKIDEYSPAEITNKRADPGFSMKDIECARRAVLVMQVNSETLKVEKEMNHLG